MHNLPSKRHHRIGPVVMRWPPLSAFLRYGGTPPALPPTGNTPGWVPTHQHRKGGLYRVLGHGLLESDRCPMTLYDDVGGTIWIRPSDEFQDGRFTALESNHGE